jgi:hypothetical protein
VPRPPLVTLRLTRPPMRGELVRQVQHALRGHGIEQDGAYGCETAAAVASWQWRTGAPHHAGAIVPDELLVLLGLRRRPVEWLSTASTRRGGTNPTPVLCRSSAPDLRIVPRSEWLDFEPGGISAARHYPGVPHVVHWFGPGTPALGREAGIEQARGFARYHRALGWADFAYNFGILRDGEPGRLCTVLEGRGDNVRGAHSGNNTANAYPGVLILCGTDNPGPTASQLETLQALRRSKSWGRRTGHQEWSPTACPGPVLMPWITAHR